MSDDEAIKNGKSLSTHEVENTNNMLCRTKSLFKPTGLKCLVNQRVAETAWSAGRHCRIWTSVPPACSKALYHHGVRLNFCGRQAMPLKIKCHDESKQKRLGREANLNSSWIFKVKWDQAMIQCLTGRWSLTYQRFTEIKAASKVKRWFSGYGVAVNFSESQWKHQLNWPK